MEPRTDQYSARRAILVVDTDVQIRRLLELSLRNAGFDVRAAGTAPEALKAVGELALGDRVVVDSHRAQSLVPATFDVALSRATLPPRSWLPLGADLVRPGGRVFLLAAAAADWSSPPPKLQPTGQWPYLNERRWLVELVKSHS